MYSCRALFNQGGVGHTCFSVWVYKPFLNAPTLNGNNWLLAELIGKDRYIKENVGITSHENVPIRLKQRHINVDETSLLPSTLIRRCLNVVCLLIGSPHKTIPVLSR